MDFKQIQELIKLVGKSELTELKIEQENFKITLKKENGFVPQPSRAATVTQPQISESSSAENQSMVTATGKKDEKPADDDKYVTVRSPMVGTFYRSPSPDKEPFVKVGDLIQKGDHLCIIEAMKLFNEIESEYSGKIMKVLVEDARPVEYDQPLFLIDPS